MVITIIIVVVFAQPKYKEIEVVSSKLEEKEKEFNGQLFLASEVNKITKDFEPTLKEIEVFDELLPKKISTADLLVQIDYLASRNGLIIKDVSFGDVKRNVVKGGGEYSSLPVSLKISGSYNAFLNFSKDVQKNKHLMDIVNLEIVPVPIPKASATSTLPVNVEPTFNYNLVLNVYYQ